MNPMRTSIILLTVPIILGSGVRHEVPSRVENVDKRPLVRLVLQGLDLWTPAAEALVLRTGAVESLYTFRDAFNNAPELGYWQIHPQTARDILFRYLQRPSKITLKVQLERVLGYELSWLREEGDRLDRQLRNNDVLGIALCRLWYVMAPYRIPGAQNLTAQARLWKRWFNTGKGGGTVKMFVRTVGALGV